ncbi:hypothetical protein F2Q69_00025038 [Brassica cretica]|uniref:Uncharacterized protein n=1 Tax=Brassica cretica TaxID=69181 RepID=A0A8S9QFI3_BRACR|nr:hypothetical protein F2Q69_00025038 [Brassica cretica]
MDEKPMSPATRALMCDDEHVNISGKETSARVRTSQEKEDNDTSSEVYVEQEKLILSSFRDHLIQLLNRGSINGTNFQITNTNPSRKCWVPPRWRGPIGEASSVSGLEVHRRDLDFNGWIFCCLGFLEAGRHSSSAEQSWVFGKSNGEIFSY